MASLRRHPKSPFWVACFTDSNGCRTNRSTKTGNRSLAMKMAVEWEALAKRATTGQMTEARARTVINAIMEHAGHEPVTFYKIEDWMNEWLSDKKRSSEKTTVLKYEPIIRRFLEHLGPKAKAGLATLTPANIRSFRNLLHGEGRAASTVNQIVSKVVSAPLAKAVKLGYAPLNPCCAVEPLKEERTEASTFTMEQVAALLAAAPSGEWRGFMLAAFYTGQRLRDLADLNWGQVDLAQRMIFLNQSKGDAGVAVPLHPDLLDHLLGLSTSDNPKSPLFPSIAGKAGSGRSGLSEAFKRIMVKAGIPIEKRLESAGGVGRGRNNLSFHSFRHSLNSVMANAGVAQEVRQKFLGHRDAETHKIYTHLDFPSLRAAIETVPSLTGKAVGRQKGGEQ
jgi:integrase